MPLIKSGSKKAFEHNVKAEMDAHPEKDRRAQNLAIAYSIKRKNAKKKMASGGSVERDFVSERESNIDNALTPEELAMRKQKSNDPLHINADHDEDIKNARHMSEGGEVDISAKDEKRPMPGDLHGDAAEERRNSMRKKLEKPNWTDDTYSDQASRSLSRRPGEPEESDFHSDDMTTIDDAHTDTEMDMERESSTDPLHINADHDEDIKNARHMARGGIAGNPKLQAAYDDEDEHASLADQLMTRRRHAKMMAEGGMAELDGDTHQGNTMTDAEILRQTRQRMRMMAEGGEVDLDENARESQNVEDQLSYNALRKENYSEAAALERDQPTDSNLTGDSREADEENVHDRPIVDEIMRRRRSKRYSD